MSGVCGECFLIASDMEKHLLDEHGIKPSAERLAEIEAKRHEDEVRRAERMIETYGEAGSGESAVLIGIKG